MPSWVLVPTSAVWNGWINGCVFVCRTAAGPSSAVALWGSSEMFYVAAARCWWRNFRATYLLNLATPGEDSRKFSVMRANYNIFRGSKSCLWQTSRFIVVYRLDHKLHEYSLFWAFTQISDTLFSCYLFNSMKRAASLNYLNKTSDDPYQVRKSFNLC